MATKYPWIYASAYPLIHPPLETLKESLRNHSLGEVAEAADNAMEKVTLSSDWWRPWIDCERSTAPPRYEFCFDPLCGGLSVGPVKEDGRSSNMQMFFVAEIWTDSPTLLVTNGPVAAARAARPALDPAHFSFLSRGSTLEGGTGRDGGTDRGNTV